MEPTFPRVAGPVAREFTEEERRSRVAAIESHLDLIVHACACTLGKGCKERHCSKMKEMLMHVKLCEVQAKNGCPVCKRLHSLIPLHARTCITDQCPVRGCREIKEQQQNGADGVAVATADGEVVAGGGEMLMKRARKDSDDDGVDVGAPKKPCLEAAFSMGKEAAKQPGATNVVVTEGSIAPGQGQGGQGTGLGTCDGIDKE